MMGNDLPGSERKGVKPGLIQSAVKLATECQQKTRSSREEAGICSKLECAEPRAREQPLSGKRGGVVAGF